nr:hypothetical protein [Tanacetum cinerariifolium]
MPPKCDLRLIDEHFESVSVDGIPNITPSDVKTVELKHDESEKEISPIVEVKIVKPSIEKIKFVKTARETVKNEESPKQHKHHPRENQRNWNNLMSQRLGINTAGSKSTVDHPILMSHAFKRVHSQVIRPFNKYSAYKKTIFNKEVNAVKASGCWVCRPKQNITDHVSKQNSASLTLKRFDYIDVQAREARLKLMELMELSTKLSDRVLDLEKIKAAQAKEITDLKKRVKKLERKRRSRTQCMNLFKIGTSRRRGLGEDNASKQGRNLK